MTIKQDLGNKGFTLAEMIIVIAIVFVVGAISYPSFQRYTFNSQLRTLGRDLAADFASLKEKAMSENTMYRIALNVNGNSYSLQRCQNQGSPCGGYDTIQVKNLSDVGKSLGFNAGGTTVTTFDVFTRGTVTNGTIALNNSLGSAATLTINLTGRTNVAFNMH